MTRLVAVEGPQRGTSFEVAGGASIGRSHDCAVRLEGAHISRVHARFEERGPALAVVDAESRNGIFVNGRRVRDQVLAKDDEIEIGEHVLVFDPSFDVDVSAPLAPTATDGKAPSTAIRDSVLSPFAEMSLERLQAAIEAARKFVPAEEDKELAKAVLAQLMTAGRAWRGVVAVMGRHGRMKPLVREVRDDDGDFRVSNVLYNQVCRERRSLIATDVAGIGKQAGKPVSILAAPLVVADRCFGFVYLDAPAEGTPPAPCFTRLDLQFAAAICALAAPLLAAARRASKAKTALRGVLKKLDEESPIIWGDGAMKEAFEKIDALADKDAPVLLLGEPGTGREYFARAIHRRGARASRGFVAVPCAALASAADGSLFGGSKKAGLIEAPRGGTVFLSEIADLPPALQEKLERVLEAKELGADSEEEHSSRVRIMASSSQDLSALVRDGKFRTGLLSKFAAAIKLPPLRERKEDIHLLIAHFLKTFGRRPTGSLQDHITQEGRSFLESYAWPGNVRELRNAVERMLLKARGAKLGLEHVPSDLRLG